MASKYDQLRDEQSQSTPSPELQQEPELDQAAGAHAPSLPEGPPNRSGGLSWSMDQSMPAQNAAANAWAKESHQRRHGREEERDAPEPDTSKNNEPELEHNTPGQEQQPERKLRFYEDREGASRERGDRADLKREQSAAEPSKGEGGERTLSFARDRGSAPDLER